MCQILHIEQATRKWKMVSKPESGLLKKKVLGLGTIKSYKHSKEMKSNISFVVFLRIMTCVIIGAGRAIEERRGGAERAQDELGRFFFLAFLSNYHSALFQFCRFRVSG